MEFHPKFGSELKTDGYTLEPKGYKTYFPYNTGENFSGWAGQAPKLVYKWLERAEKGPWITAMGFYCGQGWPRGEGSHKEARVYVASGSSENLGFLTQTWGQWIRESSGIKSCQQPQPKRSQTVMHSYVIVTSQKEVEKNRWDQNVASSNFYFSKKILQKWGIK